MPSFAELQEKLTDLRNQRAVFTMLVEHVDQNFRSIAGQKPKNFVKTDEGNLVPEQALESVTMELNVKLQAIEQEIATVLASNPL